MELHFDEELKKLNTDLLKMATLTETAIDNAINALKNQDKEMAQKIIDEDVNIDELENKIEKRSINLLALRQPMAKDLRFITTGMKINGDLERIADLTVNIAQRTLDISDKPLIKPLEDIPVLGDVAKKMLKNAIDSFVNHDQDLAKTVILEDPKADELRNSVYEELTNDYIAKDGKCADRAIPLILIARDLERICDLACAIAEEIIYMIQAKVVKHHLEKLDNGNNK